MMKKSYMGFVLWMIGFTAAVMAVCLLPIEDKELLVRIVNNLCTVGIEVLMILIYKTEKVFWINGISFEEAVAAGSDRRRAYARRYVKLFGIMTAASFLYSFIAQLLHLPWGIDVALIIVGLTVCAFGSMRFRL